VTVNPPLADREDRTHSHNVEGVVTVSERHIAADGCCNDQGTNNGPHAYSGATGGGASGLPYTQLMLCTLQAADPTLAVPYGAVVYMWNVSATAPPACPASFMPWLPAAGRAIIPGYIAGGGQPIISADPPLALGEDRVHAHSYSGVVTLDDVSYVGIDGCCNDSPGAAGDVSVANNTDAASTGVPYITALTCASTAPVFNTSLPPAALLFSPTLGCQTGWTLATYASGRFLVSLPADGQIGADFGAASLPANATQAPGADHSLDVTVSFGSNGVGLASGCCADGYAAAGSAPLTTNTDPALPLFPFAMVPLCQQIGA
jgi:hypothetical protein